MTLTFLSNLIHTITPSHPDAPIHQFARGQRPVRIVPLVSVQTLKRSAGLVNSCEIAPRSAIRGDYEPKIDSRWTDLQPVQHRCA